VGSPDLVIRNEEDFFHLLTQNTKRPVNLLVFRLNPADSSADVGALRTVTIVPDFGWGGEGCVGCDVGAGMLHWIPALRREAKVESKLADTVEPTSCKAASPIHQQFDPSASSINQATAFTAYPVNQTAPLVSQTGFAAPPVIVSVPQSRPVIANLSSSVPVSGPPITVQPPVVSVAPHVLAPSSTLPAVAPPVIPSSQAPYFVEDDIPKPNFKVPSEIFAASASIADDRPQQAVESDLA
jgi:hypothetical protein